MEKSGAGVETRRDFHSVYSAYTRPLYLRIEDSVGRRDIDNDAQRDQRAKGMSFQVEPLVIYINCHWIRSSNHQARDRRKVLVEE